MNTTLLQGKSLQEIKQVGRIAVEQASHQPEDHADVAAGRILGNLQTLYAVAACVAKAVPSMKEVAEVWGVMEVICDNCAKSLSQWNTNCPELKASHDRILDIRNRCTELKGLHLKPLP